MRLHRFYVTSNISKEKINSFSNPGLVHQLRRVFRLHAGDKAIFFDGTGDDHVSEIVSMTDEKLEFRVLETSPVKPHSSLRLSLAVSLIKKDHFEWVIEKGTEIGVSEFIPVMSERSEKKGFNMERARKIMVEAVEQSGRTFVPEIREPMTLEEFLAGEKREVVAFHTEGADLADEDIVKTGELVACVGPEGGWSEREVEMFREKGAAIVKLNSPVLRAETAAIAVATLLLVK
ncbi:MAG: 16S rRNA (uracil(1498)-N(3))-methyltransferase [Candidatus Taylorbacteria bacterium]|nr:16S rRNA (uracil(1498)-N(3))-methyltransferase [Candidatus Taylorbacteria bacterium]